MNRVIKILKISDGKNGHINNTDSIINCLKEVYKDDTLKVTCIETKIRVKIFLRLLRILFNSDKMLNYLIKIDNFLNFFYKFSPKHIEEICSYDYIISSGGDTSFFNIFLAKKYGIKNIYASQLRGLKHNLFYLILTIFEKDSYNNSILMDLPPLTKKLISNADIDIFKKKIGIDKEKLCTLLIGGDGSGYTYTQQDYKNLIDNFLLLLKKNNFYGLITTSRRTNLENEKIIQQTLMQSKYKKYIKYLILFNHKEEFLLNYFFNLSDTIVVTEDSGSMITEAIVTNKKVYIVHTKTYTKEEKYQMFLSKISKYIVKRVEISSLGEIKFEKTLANKIASPTLTLINKMKVYFDERES